MATCSSTMGTMERILRLMAEKKASDVYLSAHSPALIRINGQCVPINSQIAAARRAAQPAGRGAAARAHRGAGGHRRAQHGASRWPASGNFRISAMRQRGTYAAVIRYHPERHPAAGHPDRAAHPGRPDHGKTRPDPDGGRHRRRQEHHAGVHDRPPQRKRAGPHPDHRGPDRVPVQEQEVGGQPARGRHRHRSRCRWR